MKTITTIEGCPIHWDGTTITFKASARIDSDGSGSSHGDPCFQPDTSLHNNGKPLNSDKEFFIVLPPQVIKAVPPVVLGSQATVTYKDVTVPAVVGDVGPYSKIGEISIALANALGINSNPSNGGVESPTVSYTVTPGVSAVANGVHYTLQPYK